MARKKRKVIISGSIILPSVTEAAKWLNYSHGSVIKAIKNGYYVRGYRVDYYDD